MIGTMDRKLLYLCVLGQLTKKDQATVQAYLSSLSHKWMLIGAELKIDSEYLQKLRKKKFSDKDRLKKVISSWLKQKNGSPTPTWSSLCSALWSRAVGETGVAEHIRREKDAEFELDELSTSMVPFNRIASGQ